MERSQKGRGGGGDAAHGSSSSRQQKGSPFLSPSLMSESTDEGTESGSIDLRSSSMSVYYSDDEDAVDEDTALAIKEVEAQFNEPSPRVDKKSDEGGGGIADGGKLGGGGGGEGVEKEREKESGKGKGKGGVHQLAVSGKGKGKGKGKEKGKEKVGSEGKKDAKGKGLGKEKEKEKKEKEKVKIGEEVEEEGGEERYDGKDPLDLENYYDALRESTFPTFFLPLDAPTADAIVRSYEDWKEGAVGQGKRATGDDAALIQALAKQVDEVIAKFDSKAAFVRLSTRSPKDYALRAAKTKKILKAELKGVAEDDEVSQVIAIIRTMSKALMVKSGQEVVTSFVQSERIYQDLFRRLLKTGGEDFTMQVVVREWVDILPEYEYRGFAAGGKLNALTQYYKACFVPQMVPRKQEIAAKILALFEEVKDLIPVTNYVIDFAVTPDRVYIVELNHWGITASSSLFDWKKDHDVMHNGPFEFRIVEKPYPNAKAMIAGPLKKMMGELLESWNRIEQEDSEKGAGDDKKGHKKKKAKHVPLFASLTGAYRLSTRAEAAMQVNLLLRAVKYDKVWGSSDYLAHWELDEVEEGSDSKSEGDASGKGGDKAASADKKEHSEEEEEEEEDEQAPSLSSILGIKRKLRFSPSDTIDEYRKKQSPNVTPTIIVLCVLEVIMKRHHSLLTAEAQIPASSSSASTSISKSHSSGTKEKEKQKKNQKKKQAKERMEAWEQAMDCGYRYVLVQYGLDQDLSKFNPGKNKTAEMNRLMLDVGNMCMFLARELDIFDHK